MNILIGATTITVDDSSTNKRAAEQAISPEQWWANNIMGLNNQFVAADQVTDMQEVAAAYGEADEGMKDSVKTALGLMTLLIIIGSVALLHIRTERAIARRGERIACRSFGADYAAAQNALAAGANYLDANHDGIACNSIPSK